jgi:ATP-dependent protease Clp ATPase subunit
MRPARERGCNLCENTQGPDRRLVAGPGVVVCERCVRVASTVTADGVSRATEGQELRVVPTIETAARCGFCGRLHPPATRLVAGQGLTICSECITLCEAIIDDRPRG